MKYRLQFIGVYAQATPREMMIQNIQEMLYIKMENKPATIDSLKKALYAKCRGNVDQLAAVDEFINYQYEQDPTHTPDTVVVPADGTHYIQFDIRPERA
jgi:hypothetical protein